MYPDRSQPLLDQLADARNKVADYKSRPRYVRPTDGKSFGWHEEIKFWSHEVDRITAIIDEAAR